MEFAERQGNFAGSRLFGVNRDGKAQGDSRRRYRSIQVAEMGEVVLG